KKEVSYTTQPAQISVMMYTAWQYRANNSVLLIIPCVVLRCYVVGMPTDCCNTSATCSFLYIFLHPCKAYRIELIHFTQFSITTLPTNHRGIVPRYILYIASAIFIVPQVTICEIILMTNHGAS